MDRVQVKQFATMHGRGRVYWAIYVDGEVVGDLYHYREDADRQANVWRRVVNHTK